jgi:hypothetical protein
MKKKNETSSVTKIYTLREVLVDAVAHSEQVKVIRCDIIAGSVKRSVDN